MGVPKTPVQIGSLDESSIDLTAGRISQSSANTLLAAVNHLAFDFDHTPTLPSFMNRSVIQIRIYDPLRISGSAPLACRFRRDQLVKKLGKDRTVMGQLVGNKQGLTLKAAGQILKESPCIIQFPPANPERNQKACGGVDGCPDPSLSVLAFEVFFASRTFLFFTNVHNSSSWVSLSSSDFRRLEST